MITIHDAFKIAYRGFANCTEIDVYKHEYGNNKANYDMKKIGQMKAAYSK